MKVRGEISGFAASTAWPRLFHALKDDAAVIDAGRLKGTLEQIALQAGRRGLRSPLPVG